MTYLRRQVSLPAHGAIAVLLGMVMVFAAALGAAAAGQARAAIFLAAIAGVQVCLNLGTRYVEGA